jgi:hypothetical protein
MCRHRASPAAIQLQRYLCCRAVRTAATAPGRYRLTESSSVAIGAPDTVSAGVGVPTGVMGVRATAPPPTATTGRWVASACAGGANDNARRCHTRADAKRGQEGSPAHALGGNIAIAKPARLGLQGIVMRRHGGTPLDRATTCREADAAALFGRARCLLRGNPSHNNWVPVAYVIRLWLARQVPRRAADRNNRLVREEVFSRGVRSARQCRVSVGAV